MIEIYTTRTCGWCRRATALLDSRNLRYTEIRVDEQPQRRAEMLERSGRRSVPQICIDGRGIGGCDELFRLAQQGRLEEILEKGVTT